MGTFLSIVFGVFLILLGLTFMANALNSLIGRYGNIRRWKNIALALTVSGAFFWWASIVLIP